MQQYWVVGGEYKDTQFKIPEKGKEQWIGPYSTYEEAKAEWSRKAWETVDNCHIRYRIEQRDPDEPPATD